MSNFFYSIFLFLYVFGVRVLSLFNPKAKLWLKGRKTFPTLNFSAEHIIWVHCASLGEFEQGRPVIENIRKQFPESKIVLTFFSPSGYTVQKNYSGAHAVFYLPMDSKSNAKKFIDIIKPSLVIWVKYEYWFYYLQELKKQEIPVLLVSGIFRENQPFFKWYGGFWKAVLPCFTHLFLQDKSSEILLNSIAVEENITVNGDTRFDRVIEIAEKFEDLPLIKAFCGNSKIIVAGSTWEDDEAELIHYVRANPNIKFIIAPHEIDAENLKDVQKEFTGSVFYSDLIEGNIINSNVLIIDNVGMLSRLYHYADITYIGGGFGDDGVHNVLEAAVYGKPVIYGPEIDKFIEAVELTDCGGGIVINNAIEFEKVADNLWKNKSVLIAAGAAAKNYVYSKSGASKKIMDYIYANRLLTN